MQKQAQTNWSWAAVASSVYSFYGGNKTQCEFADWAFSQNTCCVNGSQPSCNQPFSIAYALENVNVLCQPLNGSVLFPEIAQQIDAGFPVVIVISWEGMQVNHSLIITGYDNTDPDPAKTTITLQDPLHGETIAPFEKFPINYYGAQAWTHTYLTKAL